MKNSTKISEWKIYRLTNPAGRVYVGKSSNFEKRMSYYRQVNVKEQKILYNSLLKYGFQNHEVVILDEFSGTNAYADDKEMFWIRTFMSNICKFREQNGMNLTDGGDGMSGYVASEETRKKQSIAKKGKPAWNKGIPMRPEQIELLRKINTGKRGRKMPPFKGTEEERRVRFGAHNIGHTRNRGRKYSDEYRKAMSERRKGVCNIKNQRGVIQYDSNGEYIMEYDSLKKAASSTGLSEWTVGNIAKGLNKKPHKYIFKYK